MNAADLLARALDAVNQPAFVLWGANVSWAELIGDVSGAACVWLVARQNLWNWPIGLVNNVFWCALFWVAKLYADSVLQLVFFALGVYGWWTWVFGGAGGVRDVLPVTRTPAGEWLWLGVATTLATIAVAWWLATHTDSPVPAWDASVLSLSLAATYGQARKRIESWWVWIAVDVMSVPLYVSRALYPTALLYFVFGCMCVKGLVDWWRTLPLALEAA